MEKKFMDIALKEALKGIRKNHGGPFGAVIIQNNNVISKAHNEVIKTNDPTAHAEILAIRKASKKLKRFDLSDCVIYSTCEPCPMCFAAIHWAKIKSLFYGCSKEDAARIGFDDKFIYEVIKGISKKKQVCKIQAYQAYREKCLKLFKEWENKENKIQY